MFTLEFCEQIQDIRDMLWTEEVGECIASNADGGVRPSQSKQVRMKQINVLTVLLFSMYLFVNGNGLMMYLLEKEPSGVLIVKLILCLFPIPQYNHV